MKTPVTLAIDTSRERLQLALLLADGSEDQEIVAVAKGHAEILFDAVARLLQRHNFGYGDIERIGVAVGPGSFTGLRIGLSAARGFGLALSVPVIGVPNLLALSLARTGPSEIILDAKRGQAYRQTFAGPGDSLGAPELVDLDAALAAAGRGDPDDPMLDIARLARFAAMADPTAFPPDPLYIRAADAKPQTGFGVAHQ